MRSVLSDIPNPHDGLFKELLSRVDAAQDIARNYLPPTIVQRLDLQSMELVKDSWVDEELRQHFADVLYRLKWLNPDGSVGDVYLFVLFEHKSQPDAETPFQLLRYMVQQWHSHLKTGSLPLPFIIPLVMYHGEAKWNHPQTFECLFGDIPADMRGYVPQFSYELLDLSLHSKRQIVGDALVRSTFSLMQSVFAANLDERLPEILKTLATIRPAELRLLEVMLRYVSVTGSLSESDLSAAVKAAFPLQASELMPTLAETWMERGMERGMEKGMEKGVHSGQLSVIVRQLTVKFGDAIDSAVQTDLGELSTADLSQLSEDLLKLTTVDELRQWLARR